MENAFLYSTRKAGEDRFRLLAESIPQMIWTADKEGNFDYCNKRWVEYTGLNKRLTYGHGWMQCVSKHDMIRITKSWRKAIETGDVYEEEFRIRNYKTQEYRWHLVRALPIKDNHAHVVKWFGSCTDIDDQKKLEEKKDEFISIASHELKTPLTSIKAYVQLLERTLVNVKEAEPTMQYIKRTNNYINKLTELIADLLDVSRIQSGKLRFNMQEFDLNSLVEECVESVQNTTETHHINIKTTQGVLIKGDKSRLEQVLTNFLTNAIKYSPQGQKVEVKLSKVEDGWVTVGVQDYGIGIEEDKLQKVFDRFYRVESTSSKFPGLGIGLYISSEIIKRHNGKTWVESEPGVGTTFYFKLQLAN